MGRGMTRAGVRRWKNFERDVARELRKLAPGARRCLQYQRDHGAPDVAAGALWVECKSGRRRAAVASIYQEAAKKAGRGSRVPAVVSKAGRRRGPKLVTLSLEDFIRLARATPKEQKRLWRAAR